MIAFLRSTSCTLVLAIISLAALVSCQKSKTAATPPSNRPKIDACSLITKEEAQSLQGSPIKDLKGSENADGAFRVAQCFYTAETFNKSVSLAVTQTNPASPQARNVRDFWKEAFSRYEGEAKKEEGDEEKKKSLRERGEEEERERGLPPKKVDGIGDSAYWTANRVGGALYVLKNDVFIRISVGGPDAEEAMINRCKALAEKALSRL
ncbi:MAG TPA: hypothetical protein VEP30_01385 [Chthoniobacterales bacterium]|nr:hypothetical protein [Chthoniobacterales bacterium]